MVIIFQQSTHLHGGFFWSIGIISDFRKGKNGFLITRNWKKNSYFARWKPQYIVPAENIAKNPPGGDKKLAQKVSISPIDFVDVN